MQFKGKYRFLSNFFPSVVYSYPSVEHAYQAAKTLDMEERAAIKACSTPVQAKRMGRKVTLRSDWDVIKVDVMDTLVRRKFENYPRLRQFLVVIDADLVEHNNWHDNFWGDCQCRRCYDIEGCNYLGNILMKVRDASK